MRLPMAAALALLGLTQVSPARLVVLTMQDGDLATRPMPGLGHRPPQPMAADLDGDGQAEVLEVESGRASLRRETVTVWSSPAEWEVRQARLTDLDQDEAVEIALLIWRDFEPWPIDAYIPSPGRIAAFHDSAGRSCHLILIGWQRGRFAELWAGSALARPLAAFEAVDVDADGSQELAALEGRYDDPDGRARTVTVWAWNGFGFTLRARSSAGRFTDLTVLEQPDGLDLLLAQDSSWRQP